MSIVVVILYSLLYIYLYCIAIKSRIILTYNTALKNIGMLLFKVLFETIIIICFKTLEMY